MNKQQYIEYLIATPNNYTCTNLADHLEGEKSASHDTVSDYLKREKLTPRGLWDVVSPLINDSSDSYIIVDDSVQDKRYSNKIELVKRQYSGAAKAVIRGIGVVNLLHSAGKHEDFYPIDYRIFAPEQDGKTKHQHFQEMLIRAKMDKQLQAKTVLFDSWYACPDTLKLIVKLDMFFVTTLADNRLISLSKEEGYVHLEDIDWTTERLKYGISVKLKELPFRVHLFKVVAKNGNIDWVITNKETQVPMTTQDIQEENAVRWQIEQLHREVKQLVGMAKCQCRHARSQRNHLACGYLAWLALKVYSKKFVTTLYAAKSGLWHDYLVSELRQPTIQAYGIC